MQLGSVLQAFLSSHGVELSVVYHNQSWEATDAHAPVMDATFKNFH